MAQIAEEAEAARSTKVSLDRLSAEITEALAERTGAMLDRLAAEGALSPGHRAALAADPAYGSLERLLRTAEIAGHDPATVLEAAVTERDLDDALHPARVLHSRINTRLQDQLTPHITFYTDMIPDGVPEEYRAHLQDLAADADERRRELGARVAENPPQWAREALGPVPTDLPCPAQEGVMAQQRVSQAGRRAGQRACTSQASSLTQRNQPLASGQQAVRARPLNAGRAVPVPGRTAGPAPGSFPRTTPAGCFR